MEKEREGHVREDGLTVGTVFQEGQCERGQKWEDWSAREAGHPGAGPGLLKSPSCISRAVGICECGFKPLRNRIRFSVVKRSFWPQVLNRMESKGKADVT